MQFLSSAEEFYSSASPAELLQQVRANIAPPLSWHSLLSVEEFLLIGKATANSFSVSRNTKFGRQNGPRILGRIKALRGRQGCLLRLRYQPSVGTLLAIGGWVGAVGLFIFSFIAAKIFLSGFSLSLLIPVMVWLAGLSLFLGLYQLEIKKVRQLLITLLNLRN
jgi:hypothetical protein